MSMHNPKEYEYYNEFQKRDAYETLNKYKKEIGWKTKASVIDLGCGDGLVTNSVLKLQIPKDYKELRGVDISKEMVDYANETYGNEKMSFTQFDITGEVPDELKGRFDHAYSSYVIQFLPNQEKVFKNIYEVLKQGSSFIVIMLGRGPYFETYHEMAKNERWQKYLKNVNQVMPQLFEKQNWEKDYKKMLENIGFKDCIVLDQSTSFVHEYSRLKGMAKATNFYKLDPNGSDYEDFFNEYMNRLLRNDNYIKKLCDNFETFRSTYSQIIVFGRK